jgi:FkbM family methyltransferase
MLKKIRRVFVNFVKYILYKLPFLRRLEIAMRFKRIYKRNFGNIKFQGAHFQDLIAFLYLQNVKKGFYIDIGANDGISGSNTYIFEQIGWNGICIEPLPNIYKMLKRYRNCTCYNVAVSSETSEKIDFFKATASALSGLNKGMSVAHKQWAEEYGKTEIIKVKTMTFDEIMANYPNVNHIDFLSMDVEGHEIPILETIDFKKYTFGFLTIERSNGEKIRDIMKKNGYRVYMERGADIMFIPE